MHITLHGSSVAQCAHWMMCNTTLTRECVCSHHSKSMVIHDERLIDRLFSLSVPRFVPFRVSLLYLALLFPLLPVLCPEPLLPCGQRQGNIRGQKNTLFLGSNREWSQQTRDRKRQRRLTLQVLERRVQGKPVAKARPRRTSNLTLSPVSIPYRERKWIDIGSGKFDSDCCDMTIQYVEKKTEQQVSIEKWVYLALVSSDTDKLLAKRRRSKEKIPVLLEPCLTWTFSLPSSNSRPFWRRPCWSCIARQRTLARWLHRAHLSRWELSRLSLHLWTEHPHTAHFSRTHFILVHMHRMAQGVARRVFIKERASTRHHVSDCALSLHPLTSSSLSSASTPSLFSSSPLSWSSSSMWSKLPSTKCTVHSQNEEYCPVEIHNPLTGYEPYQLDNFDFSETFAAIFQNESVDVDTEPSYSCDAELDDELIGKALSSPLFTQEREEPTNLRQTCHSHEESLLPAQSFFTHKNGRPVDEL